MSEIKIPKWFWVVAVLALAWNAMGVMAFIQFMTMGPEEFAKLPLEQQQHFKNTPLWANAAFGVATISGLLGSLLLLLRKKWALMIFIVSFVGVVLQMINSFVLMNGYEVFGPGGLAMPVMIVVFAIFLIWHSKSSIKKGWLG